MPPLADAARLDRFIAPLPERPASFAERGCALPFTAPLLAGARLRLPPGKPPELLLPGLGGRGSYILPWQAALDVTQPTLHDRRLWQSVLGLREPVPAAVRALARAVAAEGLAGRKAAAAARRALDLAEAARQAAQLALVPRLPPGAAPDALAAALAEIGPGGDAPLPRIAGRLEAMLAELAAWLPEAPAAVDRPARLVLAAGRLTLAATHASLEAARVALAQPSIQEGTLLDALRRPDWLLDGWASLAAIWAAAQAPEEAVMEMAVLMPLPPRELDGWRGCEGADWEAVLRLRRHLAPQSPCAQSSLTALTARNERLKEMAP